MNGFSKEYWARMSKISKNNRKYDLITVLLSILIHIVFFDGAVLSKEGIVRTFIGATFFMGVIGFVLDLPNFYIEEDKGNKTEVRIALILAPFIGYMLIISGWFTF